MPPLDGNALESCLKRTDKLRAELAKGGGDDKWQIWVGGRVIAWTQMSRGDKKTKTISAPLASMMTKQLKVTTPVLTDIVGCLKGWREYVLTLYANSQISADVARQELDLGSKDPIPTVRLAVPVPSHVSEDVSPRLPGCTNDQDG